MCSAADTRSRICGNAVVLYTMPKIVPTLICRYPDEFYTSSLDWKCHEHSWSSPHSSAADSRSKICGQCCYMVQYIAQCQKSFLCWFVDIWMSSTHSLLIKVLCTLLGLSSPFCHRCTIEDMRAMLLYCTVYSIMPTILPLGYGYSWSYSMCSATDAQSTICR
jgi:hypothetical protein